MFLAGILLPWLRGIMGGWCNFPCGWNKRWWEQRLWGYTGSEGTESLVLSHPMNPVITINCIKLFKIMPRECGFNLYTVREKEYEAAERMTWGLDSHLLWFQELELLTCGFPDNHPYWELCPLCLLHVWGKHATSFPAVTTCLDRFKGIFDDDPGNRTLMESSHLTLPNLRERIAARGFSRFSPCSQVARLDNKWCPGSGSGIRIAYSARVSRSCTVPSTENCVYHFADAIKITNVQSKPNSLCYLVFEIHKYVKQKTSNRPLYPGNSVHIIFLSLVQKLPRELSAHPSSI